MADSKKRSSKNSTSNNKALQEKLKTLEGHLEAIEQSKKQNNLVSLVGLLLIILAIALFVINLTKFVKERTHDKKFRKELLTKFSEDMKTIKGNPHLQGMMEDLKSEIIPYVSKQVIECLKKDTPKFQAKGKDFANNIQNYLEKDVKAKLVKSLSKSFLDIESIAREKYPNIPPEDLKKVVDSAQNAFIFEITHLIEERLDSIRIDLDALDDSVNKFKKCDEYKKLDPTRPETLSYVKLQMVESMLELVIYQINPQKGKVKVVDTFGGDK